MAQLIQASLGSWADPSVVSGLSPIAAGDLIIAMGSERSGGDSADFAMVQSGFTKRVDVTTQQADLSFRRTLVVFDKIATASEPTTFSLDDTTGNSKRLSIMVFRLEPGETGFTFLGADDNDDGTTGGSDTLSVGTTGALDNSKKLLIGLSAIKLTGAQGTGSASWSNGFSPALMEQAGWVDSQMQHVAGFLGNDTVAGTKTTTMTYPLGASTNFGLSGAILAYRVGPPGTFQIDSSTPSSANPGQVVTVNHSNANASGKTLSTPAGSVTIDSETASASTFAAPDPRTFGNKQLSYDTPITFTMDDGGDTDTFQLTIDSPNTATTKHATITALTGAYALPAYSGLAVGDRVVATRLTGDGNFNPATGAYESGTTGSTYQLYFQDVSDSNTWGTPGVYTTPVNTPNDDPTLSSNIPDVLVIQGATGNLNVSSNFNDVDGDSLTYSITPALPSGFSLNASTGVITWDGSQSPIAPTLHTVSASDGNGGTDASDVIVLGVAPTGKSWMIADVTAKNDVYTEPAFSSMATGDRVFAYQNTGTSTFNPATGDAASDDGASIYVWYHDVSDTDTSTALNPAPLNVIVVQDIIEILVGTIPLNPATGWTKVDLVSPSTVSTSLLNGYTAQAAVTNDDLEYRVTSTLDSGVTFSVAPTGIFTVTEATAGDWTTNIVVERRVIQQDGTVAATQSITIPVPTALAIDSKDANMRRNTDYQMVVSNPGTTPTTANTSITEGNDTLACTGVTGSGPYILTFAVGNLSKQADASGYDWELDIAGETIRTGNIPLLADTGWNKVDLTSPSTAPGSLLNGYTAQAAVTNDDLEYRVTSTLDSGVTVTVSPNGTYSINEATAGDWTNDIVIERRVVQQDGTIAATETITISPMAIDSKDANMRRNTNYQLVVSNPLTVPTTSNTTITEGNDTLACTTVTGSGPYTLTFAVGNLTKQAGATGYDWTLNIAGRTLATGNIPLLADTGWTKVDLVSPTTAAGSLFNGYTAVTPVTGDDAEYRVVGSLDSGVTVSVAADGTVSVTEASSGDWVSNVVLERRVVQQDGTIAASSNITIPVPATPTTTSINFVPVSDINPYTAPNTSVNNGPVQVVSGALVPSSPNSTPLFVSDVELPVAHAFAEVTLDGDSSVTLPRGPAMARADGTGYYVRVVGNTVSIHHLTAGGASGGLVDPVASVSGLTVNDGSVVRLRYEESSNTLVAVLDGEEIIAVSDNTTVPTNANPFFPGAFVSSDGSNSGGVQTLSGAAETPPVITDTTPDTPAPSPGGNVTDSAPGATITQTFTVGGIPAGQTVSVTALGAANVTPGTARRGDTVTITMTAGSFGQTVAGGVRLGSGTDYTFTATTRSALTPVITTQPTNTTVTEGDTASFSVAATDVNTYQWKDASDDSNVSGATGSTLVLTNRSVADTDKEYYVELTSTDNIVVRSNTVRLTVNAAGSGGSGGSGGAAAVPMLFRYQFKPEPHADNLIATEPHTVASTLPIITLRQGSYYTDTLSISKGGTVLTPGTDYVIVAVDSYVTAKTGYEVAQAIQFNPAVLPGDFDVTYHAVGGLEGKANDLLVKLREAIEAVSRTAVNWATVAPTAPSTYPPELHTHFPSQLEDLDLLAQEFRRLRLALEDDQVLINTGQDLSDRLARLERLLSEQRNSINAIHYNVSSADTILQISEALRDYEATADVSDSMIQNTEEIVAEWDANRVRSVRGHLSFVSDTGDTHNEDIMMAHDGNSPFSTSYGRLTTGDKLIEYSVTIMGGMLQFRVRPLQSGDIRVKWVSIN